MAKPKAPGSARIRAGSKAGIAARPSAPRASTDGTPGDRADEARPTRADSAAHDLAGRPPRSGTEKESTEKGADEKAPRPAAGASPRPAAERRARGFRALAQDLGRLTAPLFAKRGLAAGALVTRWAEVVGPQLATFTIPERIIFARGRREDGTLAVRVENGALALELQHLAPQLIERVNGFFGYRAVERLKLTQGPLPARRTPRRPVASTTPAAPPESVRQQLASVEDGDLRSALTALATARAKRGD